MDVKNHSIRVDNFVGAYVRVLRTLTKRAHWDATNTFVTTAREPVGYFLAIFFSAT